MGRRPIGGVALGLLAAALAGTAVLPAAAAAGSDGLIAFETTRGGGRSQISVMSPDGSNQRPLTQTAANDFDPHWSPDGTMLVFSSDRDGNPEIYVMAADGSQQRRLTTNPAVDVDPSWSPDGRRILFTSDRDGDAEIYVMSADGTMPVNLTNSPGSNDGEASWSPDGTSIVFVRGDAGSRDLFVMHRDGSGQAPVTSSTGDDVAPRWSPDGARIVFSSERDGNAEIYSIDPDGSRPTRLTTNDAEDGSPAWAPGGSRIAFETNRDGNDEIYVMNADGSSQHAISNDPGADRDPDWQGTVAGFQPDLSIGLEGSSSFVGAGIHGSPVKQTLRLPAAPGSTKTFVLRVRNGGDSKDSFALRGSHAGRGYTVRYRAGGKDVTGAVAAGSYVVGELGPGRRATLQVDITPGARARGGTTISVDLRAESVGDASKRDAVRVVLRVLAAGPFAYGWPVKPFFAPHPVRGNFGDPRIGPAEGVGRTVYSFHFGADVSAPDGTPVYATGSGFVLANPRHADVVVIQRTDGIVLEYWHVVPSVRPGGIAVAYRTMIGRVERSWGHVHVSERRAGAYVNPLRPGAMGPYFDDTLPAVDRILAERNGNAIEGSARGVVDLVVETDDTPAIRPPPPWDKARVTPALVRWSLDDGPWHTAFDVRRRLPAAGFFDVFASGTRQNRRHRAGLYRVFLAHGWDSKSVRNGKHSIQVRVVDTRGNVANGRQAFLIDNAAS